ncbi:aconitate hydratase AcnA [Ensifer adhaerens]|uniref:Aconitate hydratase n=1 Tax=Ensifer adhaerens TaxID=106592 RepID=A0A9Q9DF24_ENSAD|nr:aconitate hydratase AcnA [Ensifer adhaerens]USJ28522.1 aconitate hydratase AcnA [Ensifer adhaerens]
MSSLDSFNCRRTLEVGGVEYHYYSLPAAEANGLTGITQLPFSMKVLLENLLRYEDGRTVTKSDIEALVAWIGPRKSEREVNFRPARVLSQDLTGLPAVVDLAAMRDAARALGGDPKIINPQVPVDLVIDHSVMIDFFGTANAFEKNVGLEYERNAERYSFLRWGQTAFENFRVVPPGTGICHQVNLEFLAQTVWTAEENVGGKKVKIAYPDTVVGMDSHTTMVNGLSVLGWGAGGIEAEAALLGQPMSMVVPEVVGFRLSGSLPEGATATDLVLTVTQMLRRHGVVGKFVEYFGPGLSNLALEDRATVANMAPEYGATCGFFPIDNDTLKYLTMTGRDPHRIELVKSYAQVQGLWRHDGVADPVFTDVLELDLGTVVPSIAGPRRPQDRIDLSNVASGFPKILTDVRPNATSDLKRKSVEGRDFDLTDGDVVVAAITSCTNTSNPSVLIAAGLLARKALALGLKSKPWVKTSLAPGSQVVTEYLAVSGLQKDLDALGFNLAGYGCTTCIGNSGPLPEEISEAINSGDLVACSVLSGNRNFEGRISPDVRANFLASPPLVVAYALAGSMLVDLTRDPLGQTADGKHVYLRDIWPSNAEIADMARQTLKSEMFKSRYAEVFSGGEKWRSIPSQSDVNFNWSMKSTYVQNPPYFEDMAMKPEKVKDIENARILGLFLDSITTDHMSPAGNIKQDGPAGKFLISNQVRPSEFNSFGARRGNHEVMKRGTFANIRIKNQMVPGVEGGYTVHYPTNERMTIYDAAEQYRSEHVPLVIFAGLDYGVGSSRDWAAKGTALLGVRAVVTQSFERIHRSNLIGMGVLPLVFEEGTSWQTLGFTGAEIISLRGIEEIKPKQWVEIDVAYPDGRQVKVPLLVRIDTEEELAYYRHGGILQYVLRNLLTESGANVQ